MIKIKKINDEVYYTAQDITTVGPEEMRFLKDAARSNTRQRARLCTHRRPEDTLHEMLIVFGREGYIRPHRHTAKVESYHFIEGLVDTVIFDNEGGIQDVLTAGDAAQGGAFYLKIDDERFHTFIIRSEYIVYQETTTGPFQPEETVFAPWAPDGEDPEEAAAFLRTVADRVEAYKENNPR